MNQDYLKRLAQKDTYARLEQTGDKGTVPAVPSSSGQKDGIAAPAVGGTRSGHGRGSSAGPVTRGGERVPAPGATGAGVSAPGDRADSGEGGDVTTAGAGAPEGVGVEPNQPGADRLGAGRGRAGGNLMETFARPIN